MKAVAAAWGYFVYSVYAGGVEFFSVKFNQAAAPLIATTLVALAPALISSNPIGQIILALLVPVDAILELVCEAGEDSLRNNEGNCFSVTGKIIELVTVRVSSDPTSPDPDRDDIPDDVEREWATSPNYWERIDREGRPFHPLVFNTNPLQIFVDTNLPGGYVAPSQTFFYTSTVSTLKNFAPGVVELTLPEEMGGLPRAYGFDLGANMTRTFRTRLTVAETAGTGSVDLISTARARTPDKAPGATFVPSASKIPAPIGAGSNRRAVAVTPARADRGDLYLFPGLISNSAERGGRGDVVAYIREGGAQEKPLDSDGNNTTHLRSSAAPNGACNDFGRYLVVWDHVDNCNQITMDWVRVLNADDPNGGLEAMLFWEPNANLNFDPPHPYNYRTYPGNIWNSPGDMQVGLTLLTPPIVLPYCDPSLPNIARLVAAEADGDTISNNDELMGWHNVWAARPLLPNGDWAAPYNPTQPERGLSAIEFGGPSFASNAQIDVHVNSEYKQRNLMVGAIIDTTAAPINVPHPQFSIGYGDGSQRNSGDFHPAVASDGTGFLTAWNYKDVSTIQSPPQWHIISLLRTRTIDASGNQGPGSVIDSEVCDLLANQSSPNEFWNWDKGFDKRDSDYLVSVAWIGDRYRMVWLPPTCFGVGGELWTADLNSNGSLIAGTNETAGVGCQVWGLRTPYPTPVRPRPGQSA